jgi:hypothetical protein
LYLAPSMQLPNRILSIYVREYSLGIADFLIFY